MKPGPGCYEVEKIDKGVLSRSPSIKKFTFSKELKKPSYIKTEKLIKIGPGHY